MLVMSLALMSVQPTTDNHNIDIAAEETQHISLSPPLNKPLRMVKLQTHYIGEQQVKFHLTRDIIFTPSSDENIIGYDISVELIDVKVEGDPKIISLFSSLYPEVGSISLYSYDNANERLNLLNADKIWETMIASIDQIDHDIKGRSQQQSLEYQKLVQSIKNLPPRSRKAILSQDIALLLSFVGKALPNKALPNKGPDSENMLVMVSEKHDRQNGLIKEINNFYVSHQTGLVHKLMRTNQSQGESKRKVVTKIEVKLP